MCRSVLSSTNITTTTTTLSKKKIVTTVVDKSEHQDDHAAAFVFSRNKNKNNNNNTTESKFLLLKRLRHDGTTTTTNTTNSSTTTLETCASSSLSRSFSSSSSSSTTPDETGSSDDLLSQGLPKRKKTKSCLKVRTQAESLLCHHQTLSSSGSGNNNNTDVMTNNKSVYFSTIEIRSYPLRLGDNPSITSGGPPLTIGWHPYDDGDNNNNKQSYMVQVDDYEETYPSSARRLPPELKVPKYIRMQWLSAEGYTRGEMMDAQAQAWRIQRARRNSAAESLLWRQSTDFVKRKFQKVLSLKKNEVTTTRSCTRCGNMVHN